MIKMSRLINWFSTIKNNKRFVVGSISLLGLGSFSINLLPHTIFIDKYKEIIQFYRYTIL